MSYRPLKKSPNNNFNIQHGVCHTPGPNNAAYV